MKEGWYHGFGQDYYVEGKIRHAGFYKNGGPHGPNVRIHSFNFFSTGYFGKMIEGMRTGLGKETDQDDDIVKIATYENDT